MFRVRVVLLFVVRVLTWSRLLFNPLYQWIYKGPISKQIHRFIWSSAPTHYKLSMLACRCPSLLLHLCVSLSAQTCFHTVRPVLCIATLMLTCMTVGLAASMTIAAINYVLLGYQFRVDGFYMHSFEIWLATTVVFFGSGNLGYTLLQYRLGEKGILWALIENVVWIPFLSVFFFLSWPA